MTPEQLCEEWTKEVKRVNGKDYKFSVTYYRGWYTTGAPSFSKYRRKAVEMSIEKLKRKPSKSR